MYCSDCESGSHRGIRRGVRAKAQLRFKSAAAGPGGLKLGSMKGGPSPRASSKDLHRATGGEGCNLQLSGTVT